MEPTTELLCRTDWTEPRGDGVRMKFRRDGTGFYEREAGDGRPFVHENLLHRLEGDVLRLKFAHARLWMAVTAQLREGPGAPGERLGEWELELACDPYAWTMEERQTQALVLVSDRGAALPG